MSEPGSELSQQKSIDTGYWCGRTAIDDPGIAAALYQ